ncbi:hypothetical protein MPSI1_002048 [Malassezia psittaci]|uniref:CCZ1/INTU/HSP4 first Longin domain-containing protein n=1 Tax=Malassezia psittaci TaxID=1821823 RepID=A0AAF0FEX0_9BASI|nr:hypothetical protein MPSI1_002048 [Malassezia psittaci]
MLPALGSGLFSGHEGSNELKYRPAHVHHVILFNPRLTEHLSTEHPSRLADQILFYTSIENPVSQTTIVRQVALANALIDFANRQYEQQYPEAKGQTNRRVSVNSSSRRWISVEVQPNYWLYAQQMHLPWIVTEWVQQQLQNAWDLWQTQHGDTDLFLDVYGRERLEAEMEKYFSKWVWQWDIEHQLASPLHASRPPPARIGIVNQTRKHTEICADVPETTLQNCVKKFREETQSKANSPIATILLYDDKVLWPQSDSQDTLSSGLSACDRHDIAMFVLANLVGLDRAREEEKNAWANRRITNRKDTDLLSTSKGAMSSLFSGTSAWMGLDRIMPFSSAQSVTRRETLPKPRDRSSVNRPDAHIPINSRHTDTSDMLDSSFETDAKISSDDSISIESQIGTENRQQNTESKTGDDPVVITDPSALPLSFSAGNQQQSESFPTDAPFQTLHQRLSQALAMGSERSSSPISSQSSGPSYKEENPNSSKKPGAAANKTSIPPIVHNEAGGSTDSSDEKATSPATISSSRNTKTSSLTSSKPFAALPASRATWYESSANLHKPSQQSFHDPALDGWGNEEPAKFRDARIFLHVNDAKPTYVAYTTRKLLTVIHVWQDQHEPRGQWLAPSWDLMRRTQRVVNDALLRARTEPLEFLHVNDHEVISLNQLCYLHDHANILRAGVEAQLLAAERMIHRHHIKETLAREEHGAYWVAARSAAHSDTSATSRTFLVLHGDEQRHYGITECDQQMRRLAAQHGTFNL